MSTRCPPKVARSDGGNSRSQGRHDAAVLAERMPAAMLFVPSLGGVSHHWSEDTKEADIVLGAQDFAEAAHRILAAG